MLSMFKHHLAFVAKVTPNVYGNKPQRSYQRISLHILLITLMKHGGSIPRNARVTSET